MSYFPSPEEWICGNVLCKHGCTSESGEEILRNRDFQFVFVLFCFLTPNLLSQNPLKWDLGICILKISPMWCWYKQFTAWSLGSLTCREKTGRISSRGLCKGLVSAQDNCTKCQGNMVLHKPSLFKSPCHLSLCVLGKYHKVRYKVRAPQISDK